MKSKILKIISLVLALAACVGMTVYAEPSPSASTVVTGYSRAVGKNGRSVEIRLRSVSGEYAQAVADLKTEANMRAYLGDFYNSNVTIADVQEISFSDDAEFPVTVTFTMKGVTAGTRIQVLYYDAASGKWVKLDTVAGNGTVTVTFDKAVSLIAFAVDKTTLTAGATSPKTSASSVSTVALIGLAALVAACGLKKRAVVR